VQAEEELKPFLHLWFPTKAFNPLVHLALIVQNNAASFWKETKITEPEFEDPAAEVRFRGWLLDANKLLDLEEACQKHANGKWAEDLATGVGMLRRMIVRGSR
jgi:hypothetical protein